MLDGLAERINPFNAVVVFRADLVCNGEDIGRGVTGVLFVDALLQVEIAPRLAAFVGVLRVDV